MSETSTSTPPGQAAGGDPEIVATAASYYRLTRYIMVAVMVAMGAWFAYDGWIGWPEENRKLAEIKQQLVDAQARGDTQAIAKLTSESKDLGEHKPLDILLQKILASVLPPAGIALLIWALYSSRGAYRLSGNTLHIPGHPPIELSQVRAINRAKWDKKGIAYIEYEAQGRRGTFKLDDFIYERTPTDAIFERIEQHVTQSAPRS